MIEGTWYLTKDAMLINYLLVRGKFKKTIPILVYTNLVLGDIGSLRFTSMSPKYM